MGDRSKGLIGKYNVSRVDGKEVGECIVLPIEDPNSWDALWEWADTVEEEGYATLAKDVRKKITGAVARQRGG